MTTVHIPGDTALRLRMAALHLTDVTASAPAETLTPAARVTATTQHLFALQGQDWRAARWALGLRSAVETSADVDAAFASGEIVRSWPMRGTLHVICAEDIGWMQQLTTARVTAGAARRRAMLGISDTQLERLTAASVAALSAAPSLTRDELSALWTEAGLEWQDTWRYHLVWWLCQTGLAVFGPPGNTGEPRLVLADRWIKAPRHLSGDDALCELAVRYTTARGPITDKDLAWWSGLTLRDIRHGLRLAVAAGRLTQAHITDAPWSSGMYWVSSVLLEQAESLPSAPTWQLLPAFDEHLLGYTQRSPQLADRDFHRIVPGRNGVFLSTLVHGGRVVGSWKRHPQNRENLLITPFDALSITPELTRQAHRWSRFHGQAPAEIHINTAP